MSLNYRLSEVKNFDTVCWLPQDENGQRPMAPVTHGLIFACMFIGMADITEKNYVEFATRLDVWQKLFGAVVTDGEGNPVILTLEHVRQHIGLHTNASPLTRSAFMSHMWKEALGDMQRLADK